MDNNRHDNIELVSTQSPYLLKWYKDECLKTIQHYFIS